MRTVTLMLLLVCSCSRLPSATQPTAPVEHRVQNLRQHPAVAPYGLQNLIRKLDVYVKGGELRIALWSPLDFDSLGHGIDVQANLDTDQNPETKPAGDFVARVLERQGEIFPIRLGVEPDEIGSPDPTSGGWGEICGYGEVDDSRHRLMLHIPLEALGNDDGAMDWEFLITRNGGQIAYASGSTGSGR